MRALVSLFLFFGLLIVLMSVHKQMSGFRGGGGEAIGGRTAGPSNLGDLEGFRLNEADLIYTKRRESFRGGGGEAIGGTPLVLPIWAIWKDSVGVVVKRLVDTPLARITSESWEVPPIFSHQSKSRRREIRYERRLKGLVLRRRW